MNNIHLIPTDKPSRLWTNNLRRRLELDEFPEQHPTNIAKHIYITSDEEPKVNNFYFDFEYQKVRKCETGYYNKGSKKIILTTDQDLIKDGVQAIDDSFLEWFVKNPSCEEVKINVFPKFNLNDRKNYGIIIPQEEPKQETLEEEKDLAYWKANAKEDYLHTPISVLRYITELEQRMYSEEDMKKCWNAAYIDALAIDEETYKPLFFEDFIKQFKKKNND